MRSRALLFWLLMILAFVLTQPGAIAFANWDAPYGFYKDLSVWMSCAGAGLILVLAYGVHMWGKGDLGLANLIGAISLITATIWLGYWMEKAIGGEMGYGSGNVLVFLIGGFIGLVLSLMLLPISLPYVLTGDLYYPYDRPLMVVWVAMVIIAIVLLVAYLKARKEEKLRESEDRGPSVSS
ncbi:hypothetical protein E3E36_08325 [Thermococcus sp. M36]|uniref:hypothetical protein n=1 Tax=Thermococcus sp. M36 TaxID=1638261 RepID=UPI0014391BE6|nr:hypothetical protein [Thermococcus sp. M36]NJE06144.1 hypothetical protein [Thermococcus sp. M36]